MDMDITVSEALSHTDTVQPVRISNEGKGEMATLPRDLELIRKVGRGGMGTVYLARHRHLGQLRAVKAVNVGGVDSQQADRFIREVKLSGGLEHPNLVRALDAVENEKGQLFLVMEYVEGCDVSTLIKKTSQALPVEVACSIVAQAADGLAHLHDQSIFHRDVKPSNILLSKTGEVKLADFGLARHQDQEHLTMADCVAGSPPYMAPECFAGGEAGAASDIYSLGCVLFQLLTGTTPERPSTTRNALKKRRKLLTYRGDCPPRLQKLLDRMLKPDPTVRGECTAQIVATVLRELAGTATPMDAINLMGTLTEQGVAQNAASRSTAPHETHPSNPKKKRRRVMAGLAVLALGLVAAAFTVHSLQPTTPESSALLIASYSPESPLVKDLVKGLDRSLKGRVDFSTVYLRSKEHQGGAGWLLWLDEKRGEVDEMLSTMTNAEFIVVSDDAALDFVADSYNQYFCGLNVFYCGVNQKSAAFEIIQEKNLELYFNGIGETAEIWSNFKRVLRLVRDVHDEATRIVVINDHLMSGSNWRRIMSERIAPKEQEVHLEPDLQEWAKHITFEFLPKQDTNTFEFCENVLGQLDGRDTVAILGAYRRGNHTETKKALSYPQSAETICRHLSLRDPNTELPPVPVYGLLGFSVGGEGPAHALAPGKGCIAAICVDIEEEGYTIGERINAFLDSPPGSREFNYGTFPAHSNPLFLTDPHWLEALDLQDDMAAFEKSLTSKQ